MKPNMIQATRDKRKTITRRVMKPQPESDIVEMCKTTEPEGWQTGGRSYKWTEECDTGGKIWTPRYQVGQKVYIKEAWAYKGCSTVGEICTAHIRYLSDNTKGDICFATFDEMMKSTPRQNLKFPTNYNGLEDVDKEAILYELLTKWWARVGKGISPLFMLEWAARDFLKIIDVSAGRVQGITEEDAIAEGIEIVEPFCQGNMSFARVYDGGQYYYNSSIEAYSELWDSINAKPKPVMVKGILTHYESYPWTEGTRAETYRGLPHYIYGNPWVFRNEFERLIK
ncbi:hypothetical protein LCGC14_0861800 [marine sediment metagenome]|uniref:Uncharacterized protein n=1 Tax=marine sediment metagenome TaxID=412755 RepID=A0A0F9PC52_9ZZZZ